ncbi:hypothetical protein KI387_008086, partial [Taxus chinensis]
RMHSVHYKEMFCMAAIMNSLLLFVVLMVSVFSSTYGVRPTIMRKDLQVNIPSRPDPIHQSVGSNYKESDLVVPLRHDTIPSSASFNYGGKSTFMELKQPTQSVLLADSIPDTSGSVFKESNIDDIYDRRVPFGPDPMPSPDNPPPRSLYAESKQ